MKSFEQLTPFNSSGKIHLTKLDNLCSKILTTVMTENIEDEYKNEFRVSKLPHCGLLSSIEQLEAKSFNRHYSFDFYTEIGDAIHHTLQSRMALSSMGKYVYGNWRCPNVLCNHLRKEQLRPKSLYCPKCKHLLKYEELELQYKKTLGSHPDMILIMKNRIIVMEFKSTSEFAVKNPYLYLPNKKHLTQLRSYVTILTDEKKMRPHYYFLIYISRNRTQKNIDSKPEFTPFTYKVTEEELQRYRDFLDRSIKQYANVSKFIKDPTERNLSRVVASRPCKSSDDYFNDDFGMKNAFFNKENCPFYNGDKTTCFKLASRPVKRIQELAKGRTMDY